MSCFTPDQYDRCRNALLDGFPDRTSLGNMLYQVAGSAKLAPHPNIDITKDLKNLNRISGENDDMQTTVNKVLTEIESHNLCLELVTVAVIKNPQQKEFAKLEIELGGPPAANPDEQQTLEKLLFRSLDEMPDPEEWEERYKPIKYRVCRVEAEVGPRRKPFATGFLVGEDLLLTNYHVATDFLPVPGGGSPKYQPEKIIFSFDRRIVGGKELTGSDYRLKNPQKSDEWLVASSRKHPQDGENPVGQTERKGALDYALLRLDKKAAEEVLPNTSGVTDLPPQKRGYLTMSTGGSEAMKEEQSLVIFQHPNGESLKLDIGAIGGKTETRVTYKTSTERGSSGSPCFDISWRLVALHHAYIKNEKLNQGVPVSAIVEDLYNNEKLEGVSWE